MKQSTGGSRKRGLVFVFVSPSGGGKTTIIRRILESDDQLRFSVSLTSRKKRRDEQEGEDYHFISRSEFKKKVESGDFLEWAVVHDDLYGTDRAATEQRIRAGYDVVMDIDVQGADSVKEAIPACIRIFVLPPSRQVLLERLRTRGTEDEGALERRMSIAAREISVWRGYDYVVVNSDLEKATKEVISIIEAERLSLRHGAPDIEDVLISFGLSV